MSDNFDVYTGGIGKGFAVSVCIGFHKPAARKLSELMDAYHPGHQAFKVKRLFIPVPRKVKFKPSLPAYDDRIESLPDQDLQKFCFKQDYFGQKDREYRLQVFKISEDDERFYVCVDLGGMVSNIRVLADEYNYPDERVSDEVKEYISQLNAIFSAEHINAEAFCFNEDADLHRLLMKKCREAKHNSNYERCENPAFMGIVMAAPHVFGFLNPLLEGGLLMGKFAEWNSTNGDPLATRVNKVLIIVPKSCKSRGKIGDYSPDFIKQLEPNIEIPVPRPGQPNRKFTMSVYQVTKPDDPTQKVQLMMNMPPAVGTFPHLAENGHIPGQDYNKCREAFTIQLGKFLADRPEIKVMPFDDNDDRNLAEIIFNQLQ